MVSSVSLRHSGRQNPAFSLSPVALDGDRFAIDESVGFRPSGAGEVTPAASASLPALNVVNHAPVIDVAPIYASDFETPDNVQWRYYQFGDDVQDIVPLGDDGTGNTTLVSQGPWWTDPNHIDPGAGRLHLLDVIYLNGANGGIHIDDLRDVTISFDIKADQLVIPDGAHLYIWTQTLDPTLPWGVGQFVNYANTSVAIETLLVPGGWAHVTVTLSQNDADWLPLGSNPDREGSYSISSSAAAMLSGYPGDMGLIMLLGNGTPVTEASGLVRLDNVTISHGDVVRVKFAPEALTAGLQPLHLDVNISDPDVTTFQGYTISVAHAGGGLAGETLGLVFAPGSDLSEAAGALFLGASQIGTVSGGANGAGLEIDITAPVDASVLHSLVGSLAYGNQNAVAGEARDLVIGVDDGQGGTASLNAEVIALLPIDDGSGNDHLIGTGANETLNGGLGTDWLEGVGGNDRLDGGPGNDLLQGGIGDDWYYVDSAADVVVEAAGEGNDRVFASASYTLAAGLSVETLTTDFNPGTRPINLTGNELANAIYGNAGANRLTGGGGNDALAGFAGNDILDGGTGADVTLGGTGDDWYFVDNVGDIVVEAVGEGTLDRVFASVSYTLTAGAEIEILSTNNHGGTGAINLTGNALANAIYGNAGDNVLDGAAGADTLVGWAGNDFFYVDTAADIVVEAAGQGSDRVFASVSYTLGAGASVEMLTTDFHPGTNAINLTGNELANVIFGNAGVNILDGKGGNDVLIGNAGADSFAFTTALGAGNVDEIADFAPGSDKLLLDDAVFTAIGGLGALNANAFVTGTAAGDADDRIIYDSATGQLFYDADGNLSGAAVLFATLDGHPAITANDFAVI
jgi:Ca2+-binding RTX toxin-like protein